MPYLRSLAIDWSAIPPDSYLCEIPALRFDSLSFEGLTCFVGENGSGKSTLLEAIAVAQGLNPEGGSKNYRFSTYDSHSELYRALRLVRDPRYFSGDAYFLRAESFYQVASEAEVYRQNCPTSEDVYYARSGGRSFHRQSHGESFLHLVQGQFQPGGLYLLDEPEAALSPQRQLTLLCELHRLVQAGAQCILATHSPILLSCPGAQLYSFDDGAVHPIAYEDASCVRTLSTFFRDRTRLLHLLLDVEEP